MNTLVRLLMLPSFIIILSFHSGTRTTKVTPTPTLTPITACFTGKSGNDLPAIYRHNHSILTVFLNSTNVFTMQFRKEFDK